METSQDVTGKSHLSRYFSRGPVFFLNFLSDSIFRFFFDYGPDLFRVFNVEALRLPYARHSTCSPVAASLFFQFRQPSVDYSINGRQVSFCHEAFIALLPSNVDDLSKEKKSQHLDTTALLILLPFVISHWGHRARRRVLEYHGVLPISLHGLMFSRSPSPELQRHGVPQE